MFRPCRRPGGPGAFGPRFPVGAAALLHDKQGRVLLVQQTYHRDPVWLPPGGWVGRRETPQQAAAREVAEEVGLQVTIGRPLAVRCEGGYGELAILFEGHLLTAPDLRLSDEIKQAQFFFPDALPPMDESVRVWLTDGLVACRSG
jgi:ADP-ribose pyrophosphatase YjhB (NUDIX family)